MLKERWSNSYFDEITDTKKKKKFQWILNVSLEAAQISNTWQKIVNSLETSASKYM